MLTFHGCTAQKLQFGMEHHETAIQEAIDRYSVRDGVLGIVVVGSVASRQERVDSDVDLYLVVTDEEFASAAAADQLSFVENAAAYEGAYFDVKVVTLHQLRIAEGSADQPMRASFEDARAVWARTPELLAEISGLAASIPSPPEDQWIALMASFLAQARLHGLYFLNHGEKHDDRLLLHHAAVHFAFSVGRAVLALNRVLFAGPKYLETRLNTVPNTLPELVPRLRAFVTAPTVAEAQALLADLDGLTDWPLTMDQTLSRFIEDNELAWLTEVIPPEYR